MVFELSDAYRKSNGYNFSYCNPTRVEAINVEAINLNLEKEIMYTANVYTQTTDLLLFSDAIYYTWNCVKGLKVSGWL